MDDLNKALTVGYNSHFIVFSLYITFKSEIAATNDPIPLE